MELPTNTPQTSFGGQPATAQNDQRPASPAETPKAEPASTPVEPAPQAGEAQPPLAAQEVVSEPVKEGETGIEKDSEDMPKARWFAICLNTNTRNIEILESDRKNELKKMVNRKTFLRAQRIIRGKEMPIKAELSF